MGTNFYLKRKINESTKKVLKDCIDKDDIDTVRSILNDYKDIHIGKEVLVGNSYGMLIILNILNQIKIVF